MCRQGEPEDALLRRRVADVLRRSVEDLPLSTRTLGLLRKAHVKDVADIVLKTEDELRYYVGLREKSLDELRIDILFPLGLSFGMCFDRRECLLDGHGRLYVPPEE